MPATPIGYVAAMRAFFGMRPGTTLAEFAKELRDAKEDRAYFIAGLEQNGYLIKDKEA
jgi:hypothetical protein